MVNNQFVTNTHPSFHLWWKKSLLNHQKVSKYYENDYSFFILFQKIIVITNIRSLSTKLYENKYLLNNLGRSWWNGHFKLAILIAMKIRIFSQGSDSDIYKIKNIHPAASKFVKKWLKQRRFSVNFAKFLRTLIL